MFQHFDWFDLLVGWTDCCRLYIILPGKQQHQQQYDTECVGPESADESDSGLGQQQQHFSM